MRSPYDPHEIIDKERRSLSACQKARVLLAELFHLVGLEFFCRDLFLVPCSYPSHSPNYKLTYDPPISFAILTPLART
jgi:hypothetical protein